MKRFIVTEEQLHQLEGLAEEYGQAYASLIGGFGFEVKAAGAYAKSREACRAIEVPEKLFDIFMKLKNLINKLNENQKNILKMIDQKTPSTLQLFDEIDAIIAEGADDGGLADQYVCEECGSPDVDYMMSKTRPEDSDEPCVICNKCEYRHWL